MTSTTMASTSSRVKRPPRRLEDGRGGCGVGILEVLFQQSDDVAREEGDRLGLGAGQGLAARRRELPVLAQPTAPQDLTGPAVLDARLDGQDDAGQQGLLGWILC